MIDAADVVRDFLLTKTAVTTLTGTRIWAELTYPPPGYKPSTGAAIVFKATPGGFLAENALLRVRWQFKVYGPDVYAIRNLYLALMDTLHDVRGEGGMLTSQPSAPGTMLSDPETEWPFMLVFIETVLRSGLPTYSPA